MRRAVLLLLLAVLLLAVAWVLAPSFDSERPFVSLALLVTGCGGFGLLMAGTALAVQRPQPETAP